MAVFWCIGKITIKVAPQMCPFKALLQVFDHPKFEELPPITAF